MLLCYHPSINPAYNLALEEYMLTGKEEEVILLWRNNNAVIIGKNQNAYGEINLDYVKEKDISVIRRLTGGGAVFHDLGNVNYTFIHRFQQGMFNNYARFTAPIRDFLRELGVEAELSGRNDLLVDGMKISGNAQTVRQGRMLHHGTLLFSSDIADLSGALKPKAIKLHSSGVQSVASRVTNISDHLTQKMGVMNFVERLYEYLLTHMEGAEEYTLTDEDRKRVEQLVEEKYGKDSYNYGLSPTCTIEKTEKFSFGVVELYLTIANMQITQLKICGDFFGILDMKELEQSMCGCPYEREAVLERVEEETLSQYIAGMTPEQFAQLLF